LQLPLTPEQFCKAGIAAVDAACVRDHGVPFAALKEAEADAVLVGITEGHISDGLLSLVSWFNELVYPLFIEACFADPMYGGNRNAVFWKMIGYPGLPANHAIDMVRYRGKPYPGAENPKSIGDFS
jgi:gluconate 2-dehydrogenase gamma chain